MARHKNANWNLPDKVADWHQVEAAILLGIRDELQTLNELLRCPNVRRAAIAAYDGAQAAKRIDRRLAKRVKLP